VTKQAVAKNVIARIVIARSKATKQNVVTKQEMAKDEKRIANNEWIKAKASELGFSYCGIAKATSLTENRAFYEEFIRNKQHLSFAYLETNLEKRLDPSKVMPDVKSVITLLMNYYPEEVIPEEDNFVVSKYAYGKDYHLVMKRSHELVNFLKKNKEGVGARAFVDSGSILEKVWAQKSGVGWQGKNTLLINKKGGSFFFIGIILTTLDLEPDEQETDHCGNCTRCQQACPTQALDQPYQLNISRCISYQTIENKEPIPEDFKGKMKNRIYGCDICQDVCPFNRQPKPTEIADYAVSASLAAMRRKEWLTLSEKQFEELFRESSIARIGYAKLMENIRFASDSD
jgi:epoxyqueuosine reductase